MPSTNYWLLFLMLGALPTVAAAGPAECSDASDFVSRAETALIGSQCMRSDNASSASCAALQLQLDSARLQQQSACAVNPAAPEDSKPAQRPNSRGASDISRGASGSRSRSGQGGGTTRDNYCKVLSRTAMFSVMRDQFRLPPESFDVAINTITTFSVNTNMPDAVFLDGRSCRH